MEQDTGLITAYILDGQGSGRKISWNEINTWQPDQGVLWVHLNYTAKDTQEWLKKSSHLDKFVTHSLLARETRPRSVVNKKGILVLLRGVNLNPGKDPEDMVSIRIWLDEKRIITTRNQRLLSVQDLEATIKAKRGPKTNSELLLMLGDFLLSRIGDAVNEIDAEVDLLEQNVLTEENFELRSQIAESRRQAIAIRRYLAPQRDAFYRLQLEDTNDWFTSSDKLHLQESNDRIIRYIEDLDSARERASVTQEELSNKLSEQMNRRMYLLSLVAVIFLPLTFITGLLGINVDGIPGAKYHHAFAVVCSICVVIFAGLYVTFKRKRWM